MLLEIRCKIADGVLTECTPCVGLEVNVLRDCGATIKSSVASFAVNQIYNNHRPFGEPEAIPGFSHQVIIVDVCQSIKDSNGYRIEVLPIGMCYTRTSDSVAACAAIPVSPAAIYNGDHSVIKFTNSTRVPGMLKLSHELIFKLHGAAFMCHASPQVYKMFAESHSCENLIKLMRSRAEPNSIPSDAMKSTLQDICGLAKMGTLIHVEQVKDADITPELKDLIPVNLNGTLANATSSSYSFLETDEL